MIIKMILTNSFDPDPRVFKEAKELVQMGHDVEVLCWDRDNRFYDKPIEKIEKVKIKRFFPKSRYGSGFNQLKGYFQFVKEIRSYLKDKEYDVIHAHDIDGMFIGTFIKQQKKIIWDMHEFYNGFNYRLIKKLVYEIIARICFNKADGIIFVSESQKKTYENKLKKHTHVEVVMNAPEEEVFNNFVRTKSEKLRISFIGSVRDYKSLKLLMDVCEDYDSVTANINGMGVEYENLKGLSESYKNSNVTGRFSYYEIKELYENTDIVYAVYDNSHLNIKHAFPVKGLEAIYSETPLIASMNTDFGEFVNEKDVGFTVRYDNREDLEKIILKLRTNPELLNIKKKNIKKIKQDYIWSEQKEKMSTLYNKL